MVTVRNKFDTLQKTSERHMLNNKYENVIAGYLEESAECIPIKPRTKWRVSGGVNSTLGKTRWQKKHLYIIKETQQTPMP